MAESIDNQTAESLHGVEAFEEQLAPELQGLAKTLEKLARLKKLSQQASLLNLVDLRKQLDEAQRLSQDVQEQARNLESRVERFRLAVSERDQLEWQARFRQAFHAGYPPVEGEFPLFQIFPVDVRVDFEHELVLINNRTVRTIHPAAVASLVEKEWDRLNRERFNAGSFAKAVLRAYDLLLAELTQKSSGSNAGRVVPLRTVHQLLALKSGLSGYGLNQFAFDIYRLRRSESMTVDGRRLEFGTTRNRGGIVITHPGGQQETLGSLEVIEAIKP